MRKTAPPAPPPVIETEDQIQLRLARAQNAYLHSQLSKALQNAPMAPQEGSPDDHVRLEVEHLRQRVALLTLHYAEAQRSLAEMKHMLAKAYNELGWHTPTEELFAGGQELVESVLLTLLTIAHPDRWSNGQGALELAHELTVAINAQRERLG